MARAMRIIVTVIMITATSFGSLDGVFTPHSADAQETTFFRIGTGGVLGTYYRIGGVVADAVSNPPGSYPCDRGGDCGVPGLIAVAQTSGGSIANIDAILEGRLESGFVQSDIIHAAVQGEGVFSGRAPVEDLRAIVPLFQEQLQLVALPESGIETVSDLRGKRVSLDTEDSGTIVVVREVIGAFGLSDEDLEAAYLKSAESLGLLADGELDAFFIMAGAPTPSVVEAIARSDAVLVPINGPEIEALIHNNPPYEAALIDGYETREPVETIGVSALWVVDASAPEMLIHDIVKAIFNPASRRLMEELPDDLQITSDSSRTNLVIPLHPGAQRYFEETVPID